MLYGRGMRLFTRAAGATLAIATCLMLGGCLAPQSSVIPTSTPISAPVFASEEEALAAAVAAYEAYLAVSDLIGNEGGKNPERLAGVVSGALLASETDAYVEFAATGNRLTGHSAYKSFTLQRVHESAGEVEVVAYVCADVSGSRLLNSENEDVTPPSRSDFLPLEVFFTNESRGSSTLLMGGSEPWPSQDICS